MGKIGILSSATAIRRMWRTAGQLVLIACMLGAFAPIAAAADSSSEDLTAPDRRREQFPKDFGYAAFPYPYRLPGIGSGLSFAAGAFNIADTYTDAYGIVFAGDVKGGAAGSATSTSSPARSFSIWATARLTGRRSRATPSEA